MNQNIINRNNAITEHLDHIIVMWQEGRMSKSQAKILYKFIAQRLVLSGHHSLFADEFEHNEHTTTEKRTYRRFTHDDIETLKRLYARGRTAIEISEELHGNVHTVRNVIKRLQTQKVLPKRYKPRASASNININNNNEGK